jgi:hypothetical protein
MHPGPLMLIALLGAHWFFDYAGQGDFMAKAKNPEAPLLGVPWVTVMAAHAGIHAAAVALITGVWFLFAFEYLAHVWIDCLKCRGRISFGFDQFLHIACKWAWFIIAACVLAP